MRASDSSGILAALRNISSLVGIFKAARFNGWRGPFGGAQIIISIFGICLGHQIIGLANGIPTYKMFNGHRGINHPVKNLLTGKGEITSQNHGFAVNKEELLKNPDFEITHLHINDHTVAGMRMKQKNAFSVQYHPEASPGPHDSSYLFDQFIENLRK